MRASPCRLSLARTPQCLYSSRAPGRSRRNAVVAHAPCLLPGPLRAMTVVGMVFDPGPPRAPSSAGVQAAFRALQRCLWLRMDGLGTVWEVVKGSPPP